MRCPDAHDATRVFFFSCIEKGGYLHEDDK